MFKQIIVSLCVGLLMVSCYTFNKPKKPNHLISKKEMINIIIDLRLMASANGSNQRLLQNRNIYSDDYIYKKYNIDSLTFALNNSYYAYYVEEYNDIYTKVKDSLDILKKGLEDLVKKEEEEKRKTDSINRIRKKDSLRLKRKNDSIKLRQGIDTIFREKVNKIEPKLIKPASDKGDQS